MKEKLINNLFTISGFMSGMAGGFLYWKFIGCASGTCPLTSNWKIMLIYGAVVGGLLGNMIQDIIRKRKIRNANS